MSDLDCSGSQGTRYSMGAPSALQAGQKVFGRDGSKRCGKDYTRRTWVIGFQGAWIWVQDKAEIRRHITHMASISNAVMRPRTGDMEAKNSGATGIMIIQGPIPGIRAQGGAP
jgi:hypothetical protein